jgi:uncharacterized protein YndB with AHSA1/START domain
MTVTEVRKDVEARTMSFTAEFDAPTDRVWQLWADPRQLERWWGPPTYPATFTDHDLSPGGTVKYSMTGPEGDRHGGWWRVISVEPPKGLEFEDGFSDDAGNPNPDMPTTQAKVSIEDRSGGGTVMTIVSTFASIEVFEQMAEMGMEEGMREALGQIDALLAV